MLTLHEQFLAEIEAYLNQSGMDPTKFGERAMRDPNFVFRLRQGRQPRLGTVDRIKVWMAANPPSEAA